MEMGQVAMPLAPRLGTEGKEEAPTPTLGPLSLWPGAFCPKTEVQTLRCRWPPPVEPGSTCPNLPQRGDSPDGQPKPF